MPRQQTEPAPFFVRRVGGRRGEILDAAMAVFSLRGYDRGSMREVAHAVGVTEPALYRYFASKEELFASVIEGVAEAMWSDVFAFLDTLRASTLREQLLFVLAERRRAISQFAPFMRTVVTAGAHHPAFVERYRAAVIEPLRARLTQNVERLDAEFGLAGGDSDRADRVRALMALLVGTFITEFVLADTPDEAAADAVMRIMRWA